MNLNDEPIDTRAIELPICMTAFRHQKIVHNAIIIFSSSGKFFFACINTCTYSYLLSKESILKFQSFSFTIIIINIIELLYIILNLKIEKILRILYVCMYVCV